MSERHGYLNDVNGRDVPKRTYHSRGVQETTEEFNPRHPPSEPTQEELDKFEKEKESDGK